MEYTSAAFKALHLNGKSSVLFVISTKFATYNNNTITNIETTLNPLFAHTSQDNH